MFGYFEAHYMRHFIKYELTMRLIVYVHKKILSKNEQRIKFYRIRKVETCNSTVL